MTYNAANQLISSVSGTDKTAYTYDANGNLVKSENAGGARSYAYNALGLLSRFTREDGYTETYRYNTNRLLSTVTTSDNLTTALTWDILYGDGVVISENRNGEQTSYTYGLDRISALSGSTRTEYVYDGRGSVAAEVSYNNAWYTLGGGLGKKTVNAKNYTPFGELLTEETSGFGYNGEYYSAATGMIYLRARFYAPEMNRFSQKDILRGSAVQPGSLNRYLYCQNDPVNFVDPSGMRQVTGIYGDGTGRTTAQPKQTTPIITKPGVNKPSTAATTFRTAPVRLTDTGTGSYTSSNNAAKQVGNAVTNKAHTGYAGNTAETNGTSHNSGSFTESPSVFSVGNGRGFGCSKTINALGAGNYEGIGESIKTAGIILSAANDYVKDVINNLEKGEPIKIDSTTKVVFHSFIRLGGIGVDALEIGFLYIGAGTLFASTPSTAGGSAVMAHAFLEAAAIAGVELAKDATEILEELREYYISGEINVDYRPDFSEEVDAIVKPLFK